MTDTPSPHLEPQRVALLGHELRTPLNAIIGYAEAMTLETFGPLPPPYGDHAATIHRAAVHLLTLVETLTDQTHADANAWTGPRTTFDPMSLTLEVVNLLRPRAERSRIALTAVGEVGVGEVHGDHRALRQILLNLIDNALKFTADGGAIVAALSRDAGGLRLEVRDSGGATGEKGQGLGLPIVRALVRAHGGAVQLTALGGGGMAVAVSLPILTET